jgi:hypothetical protein
LLAEGGYFPLSFVEAPRPWTGEPQFYTPGQKCALSDETAVATAMRTIIGSSPAERRQMASKARNNLIGNYGAAAVRPQWSAQTTRLWYMENNNHNSPRSLYFRGER